MACSTCTLSLLLQLLDDLVDDLARQRCASCGFSRSLCVSSVFTSSRLGSIFSRSSGFSSSSRDAAALDELALASLPWPDCGKSSADRDRPSRGTVSCRAAAAAAARPILSPPHSPSACAGLRTESRRAASIRCAVGVAAAGDAVVLRRLLPSTSRQRARRVSRSLASGCGHQKSQSFMISADLRVDPATIRPPRPTDVRSSRQRLGSPSEAVPLRHAVGQRVALRVRAALERRPQPRQHRQERLPVGRAQQLVDRADQRVGAEQDRRPRHARGRRRGSRPPPTMRSGAAPARTRETSAAQASGDAARATRRACPRNAPRRNGTLRVAGARLRTCSANSVAVEPVPVSPQHHLGQRLAARRSPLPARSSGTAADIGHGEAAAVVAAHDQVLEQRRAAGCGRRRSGRARRRWRSASASETKRRVGVDGCAARRLELVGTRSAGPCRRPAAAARAGRRRPAPSCARAPRASRPAPRPRPCRRRGSARSSGRLDLGAPRAGASPRGRSCPREVARRPP